VSSEAVDPTSETDDRDAYHGSDSGRRRQLHQRLREIEALGESKEAVFELVNQMQQLAFAARRDDTTDPHERRFLQREFHSLAEQLEDLLRDTNLTLADVLDEEHQRVSSPGQTNTTLQAPDLATDIQSLKKLKLDAVQNARAAIRSLSDFMERFDSYTELHIVEQERLEEELQALSASTHQAASSIETVEFANQTALWVRAAMFANGQQAIQVQASGLSTQASHLVG